MLPKQIRVPGVLWSGVILALIVVVGGGGSLYLYTQLESQERQDAIDNATLLAHSVDVDDLYAVDGTPDDLKNPTYQRLHAYLLRGKSAAHDIDNMRISGITGSGRVFSYIGPFHQ